jgi:FkbM family methyltransferase
VSKLITIKAGGRNLSIQGAVEKYLQGFDGWDAEIGAHWKVVKDLPQGSLCIDAGANIGIIAVTLAALRPDLRIIAIEPVPDNCNSLRRNVHANELKNVEVIQAALGDRAGTVRMKEDGPWSVVQADAVLEIPVMTLDQYANQPVAFVKVDTEGYEPNVFAGARELFSKQKPLVFAEFNAWALLLHHYDPMVFSKAIWASFDVLGMYFQDKLVAPATNELSIIGANITAHGSVTDLLLRPRARMPALEEMVYPTEVLRIRRDNEALRASTSWRVTAPLRWLRLKGG